MGCFWSEEYKASAEAARVSKEINKMLKEDRDRARREVKFLLLGKSTWSRYGVSPDRALMKDVLLGKVE